MNKHEEFYEFSREADDERLRQHFRDFLVMPEIAGAGRSQTASKLIPAERITDSGEIVEIAQGTELDEDDHAQSSVMIHRNEYNDITAIEIKCACGRATIIRLEQELSSDNDNEAQPPIFAGRYTEPDQPGL